MTDLNHSRNLAVRPRAGCFHVLFLLPVLIASLDLMMLAGRVTAQTFTTLHYFTASSANSSGVYTNTDGYGQKVLISSGNTLYGTAGAGGSLGGGTLFAINTNGTGFTVLHSFSAGSGSIGNFGLGTNTDGFDPRSLILSGNTLYGTAEFGGVWGNGTVFAVNTDGTGFTTLRNFAGADGANPVGLILSGNTLYGAAEFGGDSGFGTVFKLNIDGSGFTTLHVFADNTDGGDPVGLILAGNTLYGALGSSSPNNPSGKLFALNTNGAAFTILYSFTALQNTNRYGFPTNSDGANPTGRLILSGNSLCGTTEDGGSAGGGTIFRLNIDGTGFTTLHSFAGNNDGAYPRAGLTLSGHMLYGTTPGIIWGLSGSCTVFRVKIDGTGFMSLPSSDLGEMSNVTFSGNMLYGASDPRVFSLSLPQPQLAIISSEANVILTWPTNATGFILQSATNLGSSAAVWTTNSPTPVVVDGQNTVTNPISGVQQFFRLSQ
jgi:uncharacterized repeat protein (TIGR03803 family)